MSIDERSRHELYLRLEDALGPEPANTLMEHLPPVGWADVATRHDLEAHLGLLRTDLEAQVGLLRTDLEAQMGLLRTDLEAQMGLLRHDLEAQVGLLRTDLEAQMGLLRTDLEAQVGTLRHDLEAQVGLLRTDLEAQVGTLRTDLEAFKRENSLEFALVRKDIEASRLDVIGTLRGELMAQNRAMFVAIVTIVLTMSGLSAGLVALT